MRHKLKHLIKHQHKLQAKAELQRQDLSENIAAWHGRLKWLDRGLAAAGFVKRHPTSVLGAGALLAYLIPNRSGKIFLGALAALKALRKVTGIFSVKD